MRPGSPSSPEEVPPGTLIAGAFAVVQPLGAGGGGTVYRVRDQSSGEQRALKLLRGSRRSAKSLHEFRVLAGLSHPGCVRVLDVGTDAAFGPYLVMDLVEGADPRTVIPRGGGRELEAFAARVLETLAYIHERGILHGDLKPANVRCLEGRPEAPVLLDFGHARGEDDADRFGGTAPYMAPEVFRHQPVSAATDLYALGAMLYELIAGSPPFVGRRLVDYARAHLHERQTPLAQRVPGVDPMLSRLVDALLAKAPGARPASARDVLSLLAEVTGTDVGPAEAGDGEAIELGTPLLVGRDELTGAFGDALGEVQLGPGSGLHVHGPPGSGRTRVLDEAAVQARLAGVPVVRWRAGALLAPVDELHAPIARVLRHLTERRRAGALRRLERLDAAVTSGRDTAADDAALGARAEQLLDLLEELAADEGLVVAVDDLTAAGPLAARVVADLMRAAAVSRLVVVATSDTADDLPAGLPCARHALQPLTRDDVAQIVATSVGEVDEAAALVDWLLGESGGSPAVAMETLQWLVRTRRLARRRGGWYLTASLAPRAAGAGSSLDRLAERFEALVPPALRPFLQAAAVFERDFDPALVAEAAGISAPSDADVLTALRLHLLTAPQDGPEPRLRFGQRALRKRLRDGLPEARRQAIHERAATLLEARLAAEPEPRAALQEELAFQLLAAGRWEDGAERALARARVMAASGRAAPALHLLQTARDRVPSSDGAAATRTRVITALGDLERWLGDIDAARRCFEEALTHADERATAGLQRRLGQVAAYCSDFDAGRAMLRAALDAPAASLEDRFEAADTLAYCHNQQGAFEGALSVVERLRALAEESGDPAHRARAHKIAGIVAWSSGRYEAAIASHRLAAELFEAAGDRRQEGEAQMSLGTSLARITRMEEAMEAFEVAEGIFRELGYTSWVGKVNNNRGVALFGAGHWRDATECFEVFRRMVERTGERLEQAKLLNNLGFLYSERGLYPRAEELLERALELALDIHATPILATVRGNLGDVFKRTGRMHEAEVRYREALDAAREMGNFAEELEALRRGLELRLHRDRPCSARDVEPVLALAAERDLYAEVALLSALLAQVHRRAGDLDAATAAIERGLAELRSSSAALPALRLHRERAAVLAARGDAAEARQELQRVRDAYAQLDAGWELGLTDRLIDDLGLRSHRAIDPTDAPALTVDEFLASLGEPDTLDLFLHVALARLLEAVAPATHGVIAIYRSGPSPSPSHLPMAVADWASDPAALGMTHTVDQASLAVATPFVLPVLSSSTTSSATADASQSSLVSQPLRTVVSVPLALPDAFTGVVYLDSPRPADRALQDAVPFVAALAAGLAGRLAAMPIDELLGERDEVVILAGG